MQRAEEKELQGREGIFGWLKIPRWCKRFRDELSCHLDFCENSRWGSVGNVPWDVVVICIFTASPVRSPLIKRNVYQSHSEKCLALLEM